MFGSMLIIRNGESDRLQIEFQKKKNNRCTDKTIHCTYF